ncbi:unnamed protein product [Urochloa humidicola]
MAIAAADTLVEVAAEAAVGAEVEAAVGAEVEATAAGAVEVVLSGAEVTGFALLRVVAIRTLRGGLNATCVKHLAQEVVLKEMA